MFDFTTYGELGLALLVCVVNAFLLCLISYRLFHILQLSGYKTRNFMLWVGDRKSKFYIRLFTLSILGFGSMMVVNILFFHLYIDFLSYLGLVFYFFLAFMFISNSQSAQYKVSLKLTARIKRLFVLYFIVCAIITFTIIGMGIGNPFLRFSLMALVPALLPAILLLCHFMLLPFEESIKHRYIRRANKKLNRPEFQNLIRIGITGSYGKTSCKNILAEMLKSKYKVAKSPSSFNTPQGYSKTVNNILTEEHEILIMEMGARYLGDIKRLAKLVKPKHGILTSIGPQHLDTFGSIENVQIGKGDLVRSLPKDGIAVLNGDNERCVSVFNALDLEKKYLSSITEMAKDIQINQDGCVFTLQIGDKSAQCKTRLLGQHNIINILMCATMADKLGVSIEDIAAAIERLEPTPHRLELIKAENGVFILDDSYNSSPGGSKAALEVLALFKGQKIVMTPGIVELGAKQDEENFKFGVRMSKVADKVIVVNEVNSTSIIDGLRSQNFAEENIYKVANLEDAKKIYAELLKPGDVLLIENDLPDNYI